MRITLATTPAKPAASNEDFVAATADAVVLLDGAGAPSEVECGCLHGVPWFVRQLGTTLLRLITTCDADLQHCLAAAVAEVRSLHSDTCDLDHPASPSTTVVAVREQGAELTYLVLADSVLVLDLSDDLLVVTDDREAKVGKKLRARMDALRGGTAEHEEALREYVKSLQAYRNRPDGFWVASTKPEAAEHALRGSVPQVDVRAAALLSDGASRLVDRFSLATWRDVLTSLETRGPEELLQQVRTAERSDPHGMRWPRGKSNDDATAVYCTPD